MKYSCKLIVLIISLSVIRHNVIGIPLISNIFKGFLSNDESNATSNKLPEKSDGYVIDLSTYGRSFYGQPDVNETGSLVAKLKPNDTSVNPEELGSYFEGDILLPQNSVILKNGLNSKSYRWPNGDVPFDIAGGFTTNDLEIIANAMDEYHAKTCIRFKPRTSERDYVSIVRGNSGCWSAIGRMGGKQEVNLQTPGCLTKPGTAIHELMHVLGFMHEQNRMERDSFVVIQSQNIQQNAVLNFQKAARTVAFGVAYDYGSVMHYSSKAFSKNGQPTIVAKKPIDTKLMGQRDGFSPLDIEKVNRMYNCKANSKPQALPVELQERTPQRFSFAQGKNPLKTFTGNIFNGLSRFG